jgi:ketosteroid isomerase-like protein
MASMSRAGIAAFVTCWIDAWNRIDIEEVLSHFADDTRFTSPKAAVAVGTATVEGKDALRRYWQTAAASIRQIDFALDHALWDDEREELLIVYNATINGTRNRACERMQFGPSGQVVVGEAMYGAVL